MHSCLLQKLLLQIVLLCFTASLQAATLTEAVPDNPFPGALGQWSLSYANDSTFYDSDDRFRKHDDFRTARVFGFMRIKESFIAAFDVSLLTSKQSHLRTDVVSMSLGRDLILKEDEAHRLYLQFGLGLHIADDFGGQSIQNALHDLTSDIDVEMPYDDDAIEGSVYARGQWDIAIEESFGFHHVALVSLSGQGLTQWESYLSASVQFNKQVQAMIGLRYLTHAGSGLNQVHEIVLEQESEWWLDMGFRFNGFVFEYAHHLDDSKSQFVFSYVRKL